MAKATVIASGLSAHGRCERNSDHAAFGVVLVVDLFIWVSYE
jgi:hypothetical protein